MVRIGLNELLILSVFAVIALAGLAATLAASIPAGVNMHSLERRKHSMSNYRGQSSMHDMAAIDILVGARGGGECRKQNGEDCDGAH